MPAINIADLNNAKQDVDHLAAIATSTDLTATDRFGRTKRTLAALEAEYPNAQANADAAAESANVSAASAGATEVAKELALAAQANAEMARDSAMGAGKVYTATAAGLAATNGTGDANRYFSVPSANSAEYLILYRNDAGVAAAQKTYPSSAVVEINQKNVKENAAAINGVYDEITEHLFGGPSNSTAGTSYTSADYTYIDARPADEDHFITSVDITLAAGSGVFEVLVYDKDTSGVLTLNATHPVTASSALGKYVIPTGIYLRKGQLIGFYSGRGVAISASAISHDGYYGKSGRNPSITGLSPAFKTTNIYSLYFGKTPIPKVAMQLATDNSLRLEEVEKETKKSVFFGGSKVIPENGGGLPLATGAYFVLAKQITEPTVIHSVIVGTPTVADANLAFAIFVQSGANLVLEKEYAFKSVIGQSKLELNMVVEAGRYIAVKQSPAAIGYNSAEATTDTWYFGGSATVVKNPVQSKLHIQFFKSVGYGSDNDRRITLLEGRPNSAGFPFAYNYVVGAGQSLMEGSLTGLNLPIQTPITTFQEYDSLGFRGGAATSILAPATVANTQIGSRGEWCGLGCAAYLKRLLEKKFGIPGSTPGNTIVVSNEGFGGATIAQISKGGSTGRFEAGITKASYLKDLTTSDAGALAVNFMQGESDEESDPEVYIASLVKLANDYCADLKTATGQVFDPLLYSYQLSTNRNIALAHLEASRRSPAVVVAAPMYMMTYYDGVHIGAQSERLIGAYFAQAIFDTVMTGIKFQPLMATQVVAEGDRVILTFNRTGLVLDATTVPLQTNYGFAVKNGTTDIGINSVSIRNSNQVVLTLASPAQPNWAVEYGTPVTNKPPQRGVCGNLRDNHGLTNTFDGFPLHNWCVVDGWQI